MASVEDLKSMLPKDYDYLWDKNSGGIIQFRVRQVTDSEAAKIWLDEYSKVTKTTWRVLRTFPESGRVNVFKKHFRCQHKTDARHRAANIRQNKNTDCPARLEILIRRAVFKSRARAYNELTKDYPGVITLQGDHNHTTHCAIALKHRTMSEETRQKLVDLFHEGHSASSALKQLKAQMNGADIDQSEDSPFIPSLSVIDKLYRNQRAVEYGDSSSEQMLLDLEQYISRYNSSKKGGGLANYGAVDEHYFVAVCTGIMLRVHEKVSQAGEVMIVDVTRDVDRQKHCVYTLVTPSVAGCVPVGAIVMDSKEVFAEALKALLQLLPEGRFCRAGYPTVILTGSDLKEEKAALAETFPASRLLRCQFSILKEFWAWISKGKNKVDATMRQELYALLQCCVYALTEGELTNKFSTMLQKTVESAKVQEYLATIWATKTEWALCYRVGLPLTGTNNCLEAAFKLLKDRWLERAASRNAIQLVDCVVSRFERYIRRCLVAFAHGRRPKKTWSASLCRSDVCLENISDNTLGVYQVPDQVNPELLHTVDLARRSCTCCPEDMCEHISAVIRKLDDSIFNKVMESDVKSAIYAVAMGQGASKSRSPTSKTKPAAKTAAIKKHVQLVVTASKIIPPLTNTVQQWAVSTSNDDFDMQFSSEAAIAWHTGVVDDFCVRVKQGLRDNPELFVPAVEEMHNNLSTYASTEVGLLAAISTLGKYSVGLQQRVQPITQHAVMFDVGLHRGLGQYQTEQYHPYQ